MRFFTYQSPSATARISLALPSESAKISPPDFYNTLEWQSHLNSEDYSMFGFRTKNSATVCKAPEIHLIENCVVHPVSRGRLRGMVEKTPGVFLAGLYGDSDFYSDHHGDKVSISVNQEILSANITDLPDGPFPTIDANFILLDHLYAENYAHMLLQTGSRFYLKEMLIPDVEHLTAIFHPMRTYQADFFNMMSNGNYRHYSNRGESFSVSRLWVPTLVEYDGLSSRYVNWLRERLVPATARSIQQRRLFLLRKGVWSRQISNFDAVMNLLGSYGFEPIELSDFNFHTQIEIISQAEVIVSAHGAALANVVFGKSLKVIEFIPDAAPHPMYWWISKWLGHSYARITCEMGPRETISVDLTILAEALKFSGCSIS